MTKLITNYARKISSKFSHFVITLSKMTLTTKRQDNTVNIESKEGNSYISCPKNELDLGITLKGGQSFRYRK